MTDRAVVTIQVARGAAAQQAALSDWLAALPDVASMPDNRPAAAAIIEGAFAALNAPAGVVVERIVAGCVCCTGQVVLRATLTRLLRKHRPLRVLLLVTGGGEHLDRLRRMLAGDPFAIHVRLEDATHDTASR